MMGHTAAMLFALATIAGLPDTEVSSLTYGQMTEGQHFEIATADRVYRGRLLDPSTGECQMEISLDGATFSPSQTIYLLGASVGPQDRQTLVLMRQVKVGMKMELSVGDLQQKNRQMTADVTAIRVAR